MRIKTFGNRSILSGLSSLEEAFKNLGHEVVDDAPDVLFHANGFFDDLLLEAEKYPKAIKVGILLDADPTNPQWPEEMAKSQLEKLDVKLTISETSQKQIKKRTGVTCGVCYYPIKGIQKLQYIKTVPFLWVGRLSPNKRFWLAYQTVEKLNVDKNCLVVIGPEYYGIGTHGSNVTEEELNIIYNCSEFLFHTSSHEGLGLSMIEGAIASIPILTNDNECVSEFGLLDFAAVPDPDALAEKVKEIRLDPTKFTKILDDLRPNFMEQFSPESVAKKILRFL